MTSLELPVELPVLDRLRSLGDDETAIRELEAALIPDPDTSPRPGDPQALDDQEPAAAERVTLQRPQTAARILARAATQIGYVEGANDDSKFGDWYGLPNNPWCAMFVSWVFHQEGMPLKASTAKGFAACSAGRDWFKAKGRFTTSSPKPGYVVFYDWKVPAREPLDHVGIVERVNRDGSIVAIEGNSSNPGGGRQGVFRQPRRFGIVGYGIPDFAVPSPAPPDVATRLPLLKRGARGEPVRRVQGLVRAAVPSLKDADLSLGGDFGPVTETKVRELQRGAGLEPDGEVGEHTWRMLLGIAPGGRLPALRRGSAGPPVRRLQGLLRAANPQMSDAQLSLGGSFGPVTEELVRKHQAAHGLPIDGSLDERTWAALLGIKAG
jgi:peptidoglycan hydrolase-like protein with peptidoglycan-binding domain